MYSYTVEDKKKKKKYVRKTTHYVEVPEMMMRVGTPFSL